MTELPKHDLSASAPLADIEREHILRVFHATGDDLKRSAQILGISRSTLYRRLREYEPEGWQLVKRKVMVRK